MAARKKAATPAQTKDFFGVPIRPGDTIAAHVHMNGFMQLVRRKVVSIDDEGALVCTNMDDEPVNRVKKPKKTFVDLSYLINKGLP